MTSLLLILTLTLLSLSVKCLPVEDEYQYDDPTEEVRQRGGRVLMSLLKNCQNLKHDNITTGEQQRRGGCRHIQHRDGDQDHRVQGEAGGQGGAALRGQVLR